MIEPHEALGVFEGLPLGDYFAMPGLSASGLSKLAKSPFHYHSQFDPDKPPREPTPAMRAGTALHCAVLEPTAFAYRYRIKPDGFDGRTKAGRDWLENTPAGVEVLTEEQALATQRQAASIRALPEIAQLLTNGKTEVSVFAEDDETGVRLKARPDLLSVAGDGLIICDVKTCKDASAKGFARSVIDYGYALQACHYMDVVERATRKQVYGFCFACTESEFPHAACAWMLTDEWLEAARRERRRLINLYAECKKTDTWPGLPQTIQLLSPPTWLKLNEQ
jgi:PDDEXK-like domain of unknown function (DUF3799)